MSQGLSLCSIYLTHTHKHTHTCASSLKAGLWLPVGNLLRSSLLVLSHCKGLGTIYIERKPFTSARPIDWYRLYIKDARHQLFPILCTFKTRYQHFAHGIALKWLLSTLQLAIETKSISLVCSCFFMGVVGHFNRRWECVGTCVQFLTLPCELNFSALKVLLLGMDQCWGTHYK